MRHGQGKMESKVCVFDGNFVRNKKKGYGIMVFKSGKVYKGNFENDKFSGKGVLIDKYEKVFKGCFENGVFKG